MTKQLPLFDETDTEIFMHRDAHFNENFNLMIDYYVNDGVGTMPEFTLERIKLLQSIQHEAHEMMPHSTTDAADHAKKLYKTLRAVYDEENPDELSTLISDLILSEEESPDEIIDKLASQTNIEPLIGIINSTTFYDPINPGYGRAPIFAAKVLAKIKDPKALPYLFNSLGFADFITDEAIISAILSFGDEAKEFLLKRLNHKPFSHDNERAAMVLSSLENDEEVAKNCLKILQDPDTYQHTGFTLYLVFPCMGLTSMEDREIFKELLDKKPIPFHIKEEIKIIIKYWN